MSLTPEDRRRFEQNLRRDSRTGCLLWVGYRLPKGYGQFSLNGRLERAHRVAFLLAGGVLTEELPDVLHNCPCGDEPACCEPAHLFAGNKTINPIDMAKKGRGKKSRRGLPYGISPKRSGRFVAEIGVGHRQKRYIGSFASWAVASALALYYKNLFLYPE